MLVQSNIEITKKLLAHWAKYQPKSGIEGLGYSSSNAFGESERRLSPGLEEVLLNVSLAVDALRQVEPDAAVAIVARYFYEESYEKISSRLGETPAKAKELSVKGEAWVSGFLASQDH